MMNKDIAFYFSPEEQARLQERLLPLLASRIRYDTMGDSASVPVERAEELLEGILFALKTHLQCKHLPPQTLLRERLEQVYEEAIATLDELTELARRRFDQARRSAPTFPNRALHDTLQALEVFFKYYDSRTLPQGIPCMIDYPLCIPVDDHKQGVCWILEYLEHLLLENFYLLRVAPETLANALYAACPEPKGQLINLYQTMAESDLRAMLGERPATAYTMEETAANVLKMRGISDEGSRVYLDKTAADLLCRMRIQRP